MEKQQVQERKNYGGMAFLPLITFLLIYLGVGIFFTVIGVEMPFNQLPRHSALLVGVVVGLFMDGISLLVSLLSFALVNNTVAIIIASPMAKTIGEKFKIAPKRTASLLDIFSCVSLGIAPHAGGMLFATAMSGLSPLDILQYSFYPVTLTIATVITIQFGLLRTPEEKQAVLEEKSAKQ